MSQDQSDISEPICNNLSEEEVSAIFRKLRAFKTEHCPLANKHELAIMLIGACIMEGFNTGKRITGTLERLGFNKQHAGKILSDGAGDDPQSYYWQRSAKGTYTMH